MTIYTCEKCLKEFTQKSHYDEHKNKKKDCSNKQINEIENLLIERRNRINDIRKRLHLILNNNNEKEIAYEMDKLYETNKELFFEYYAYDNLKSIYNRFFNSKIDLSKLYKQDIQISNNIITNFNIDNNNNLITSFKHQTSTMDTFTSEFTKAINRCHDTLRTRHQIIGQDAHRHIMSILFVRLLKIHLTNENSLLYKKFMIFINNQTNGKLKEKFLIIFKDMNDFNKLINMNNKNNNITNYWNKQILKLLEGALGDVFSSDDDRLKCDSISMSTLLKIIEELGIYFDDNESSIKNNSYSISTSIFESFVNSYSNDGSQLGQFHTHRNIIVSGIKKFVKPYVNTCLQKGIFDIDDFTAYDACAGSGGFILENYFNLNLNPDNLYGQEVDKLTMKHLYLNMILSTGQFPKNIHNKNSFTNIPKRKFHSQGLNPPFGLKGVKYTRGKKTGDIKGIKEEYKDADNTHNFKDIYPIPSNKAENLFLQQSINLMEDNGIVQIVLPYGELVWSDKSQFIKVRKKLVEERNIKGFVLLPSDLFLSTNVGTFMIIFTNEKQTTEYMDFYDMNIDGEIIKMKSVSKIDLQKNNYSFELKTYEEENLNKNIDYITLGDVIKMKKGKKRNSKRDSIKNGKYPLFYCSIKGHLMTNEFDFDGEGLIINTTNGSGRSNIYHYDGKYSVAASTHHFESKDINYPNKFLYYYLKLNKNRLEEKYKGANQKSITVADLKKIKIPKYSTEEQTIIIKELEELYNIIENYEKLNNFNSDNIDIYYKEVIKMNNIIEQSKKLENKYFNKYNFKKLDINIINLSLNFKIKYYKEICKYIIENKYMEETTEEIGEELSEEEQSSEEVTELVQQLTITNKPNLAPKKKIIKKIIKKKIIKKKVKQ